MISKAIAFANIVHGNQKRKGTDIAYILHPLEAGIIVSQMKFETNLICAAILHDTVEDAVISYKTIEELFNERVSFLVKAQSEDKTKSWKERKLHTIESLKSIEDEDIKIVCLGDKLSNIRALYKDNLDVGDELWKRFNVTDKNEQGWYYNGLVDGLSSICKYKEYEEFKGLVFKVFGK